MSYNVNLNLQSIQNKVLHVAREAAKIMIRERDRLKSVNIMEKDSYADLVTEVDIQIQEKIYNTLRTEYPAFKFIGEENQKNVLTDEPTWIVDPIDGTMNFVHGNPHTAICIGLAVNKRPVLGVVNFPFLEMIYYGIAEHPGYTRTAAMGGKKLTVKKVNSLKEALVATEVGSDRSEEKRRCVFDNLESVAWQCHGIRSFGSAAANICAIAFGHVDAFYEFGLHSWDMCAPLAILAGAGGYYCDTTGEEGDFKFNLCKRRVIAASTRQLAEELSKALVNQQLELPND